MFSDTDIRILGFPRRDGQAGFVWIVSNTTTNADGLFVMPPDTAFDLNCEDFESISAATDIVPPVQAFLQQECRKGRAPPHPR